MNTMLDELLRRRDGIYASDLLLTAIAYLDLFTWLSRNRADAPDICTAFNLQERPVDVMLTLFRAMGLVRNQGTRLIVTEEAGRYLVKDSSRDLRPYFHSLRDRPVCREILEVLRTGVPMHWSSDPKGAAWAEAMDEPEFAGSFTAAMESRGTALAPALAEALPCPQDGSILDVAGGSGVYAAAILQRHSEVRGAVLEKEPVNDAARSAIQARGLSGRLSVIRADMFSDAWPAGFNLHLFSHVLHDWDTEAVEFLLTKSFRALEPGGTVAIHDVHVNREKSGPVDAAEYSVLLMLSTKGKCYALGELEEMLMGAGFEAMEVRATAGFRSLVTARKPR